MKNHWRTVLVLLLLAVAWQAGRSQDGRRNVGFPEPDVDARWLAQIKRDLAERRPDLRSLALEKRSAARSGFKARLQEFEAGKTTIADFVLDALGKLQEAELSVCATPADRLDVLERCWEWAKYCESFTKAKFDAGTIGPANYYPVAYTRLQLEYELVKARAE